MNTSTACSPGNKLSAACLASRRSTALRAQHVATIRRLCDVGKGHLLTTTGLLPVAAIKEAILRMGAHTEAAELRAVSFCRFAQRQRAWVRAQAQEWAP